MGAKPKFINVVVKDPMTNKTYEFEDSSKFGEFFGFTSASKACAVGKYKHYIVTSKPNPECISNNRNMENKAAEVESNNQQNETFSLRNCFEALAIIEYYTEKFNFASIEDFIDWMRNNKFIIPELK